MLLPTGLCQARGLNYRLARDSLYKDLGGSLHPQPADIERQNTMFKDAGLGPCKLPVNFAYDKASLDQCRHYLLYFHETWPDLVC